MFEEDMTLHTFVMKSIIKKQKEFADALGLSNFWVRTCEYPLYEGDFVDMIGQDFFDPYGKKKENTCYIVEIKSCKADHEVLGQIKKAVTIFEKVAERQKMFNKVEGICVATGYTSSGLRLLKEEGYHPLYWKKVGNEVEFFRRKALV